MWLTSSSVGRKFLMALTGAFLILFVTFHVLMNGVALFWPTAYNDVCMFLGANWYALVGTMVLAAGFALHILLACWLTYENRRARGHNRYAVTARPKQVEWSSKNMLVLGIVILCFLCVHMYQFWAKMQLAEVLHIEGEFPAAAGTLFIQQAFSCPWTLVIYLIGFIALWFHMTHGFWSMFQSSGVNGSKWQCRLKCIGNVWSTLVVLLFIAEAVVFTIQARHDYYLNDPALQMQYAEMEQTTAVDGMPACQQACPNAAKACPGVPPCEGPGMVPPPPAPMPGEGAPVPPPAPGAGPETAPAPQPGQAPAPGVAPAPGEGPGVPPPPRHGKGPKPESKIKPEFKNKLK